MDEFEKKTVILTIKKMFKGGHFDICTLDACIKVAGVVPKGIFEPIPPAKKSIFSWKN